MDNSIPTNPSKDLPKGYRGTVLTVDLTQKDVTRIPLERSLTALFFGGRGLGCALLFDHSIQKEEAFLSDIASFAAQYGQPGLGRKRFNGPAVEAFEPKTI